MNDRQQITALLKETFNTVSEGYDNRPLRFFPMSAEHIPSLLGLRGDEQVLDVACGTVSAWDQEQFKQEHLAEIAALRTDKGIWLDVGVLYTVGTKGQTKELT